MSLGKLARLGVLEGQQRARVAAVEEAKAEQWERAALRLPAADRAARQEHLDAEDAGGLWWAEVVSD